MQREVMNSVLSKDVKETKIDGNKLQPTVPARLLDDFQEEIFQVREQVLRLLYHLKILLFILL